MISTDYRIGGEPGIVDRVLALHAGSRAVIAVSLNVGGGVRLIKPAKLYMCTQNTTNTTRTDARRRVCAAMVSYRWATRGTSLRELEYTLIIECDRVNERRH